MVTARFDNRSLPGKASKCCGKTKVTDYDSPTGVYAVGRVKAISYSARGKERAGATSAVDLTSFLIVWHTEK